VSPNVAANRTLPASKEIEEKHNLQLLRQGPRKLPKSGAKIAHKPLAALWMAINDPMLTGFEKIIL